MPDKELVIVMDEAERELRACVNAIMRKHGLPCFLFETIFAGVHRELIDGKAGELSAARVNAANAQKAAQEPKQEEAK